METFSAHIVHADGQVVLAVHGEVDVATSDHLSAAIKEAAQMNPDVVVDLSGVTFLDSSGISALVVARRERLDSGGSVVLRSPQPIVREVLEVTQLDKVFKVEVEV